MTSERRINARPYTNPTIKNPTYPTVVDHQILEMTWEERNTFVVDKRESIGDRIYRGILRDTTGGIHPVDTAYRR